MKKALSASLLALALFSYGAGTAMAQGMRACSGGYE